MRKIKHTYYCRLLCCNKGCSSEKKMILKSRWIKIHMSLIAFGDFELKYNNKLFLPWKTHFLFLINVWSVSFDGIVRTIKTKECIAWSFIMVNNNNNKNNFMVYYYDCYILTANFTRPRHKREIEMLIRRKPFIMIILEA